MLKFTMKKFKNKADRTFFGEEKRLEKISSLGDNLEKLNSSIDWKVFIPFVAKCFPADHSAGGRPRYNYELMIKILVLQRFNNLSDPNTEFQINDRLSFQRFLGLGIDDDVPDENTIWDFRETLVKNKIHLKLFKIFLKECEKKNLIGKKGRIVDASFVDIPRQRNTREENESIKNGVTPKEWSKKKCSHKDTDARWTKKNEETHYGYKNHIKTDEKSKIILSYKSTDASVHDSQTVKELLDKKTDYKCGFWADSAYTGKKIAFLISLLKMENKIVEKGYRNSPLTKMQIKRNRSKSRVRVRVEHIFGFFENSMGGSVIRTIGKSRADFMIGMNNIVYNLFRYALLT